MSTKNEIKKAERERNRIKDKYLSLFYMLYHNSVKVENLPHDLPKRYLLRNLAQRGAIAYDYETKLFLPFVGSEIDAYGLPKKYQLYGYNGINFWRDVQDVCILRANDILYSIGNYLEHQANKVMEIEIALLQNLDAIKTTSLISVNNKSTLLSFANAELARRIGSSVLFVDKELGLKESLSVASTGAEYLCDKLQELKTETINETLATLGISTANSDKRERVQGVEVYASQGYAINCIKTLVDTFNYDAEFGGLDIRLKINTEIDSTTQEIVNNENGGD